MPRPISCQFCRSELDPAQEFAYHVESQTVSDPSTLAAIRRLPHSAGRPLRICRGCQSNLASRANAGGRVVVHQSHALLTVAAAVGVWAVTMKLSRWLA